MKTARAVVLGPGAGDVRRRVGPTAWCALEVIAASPTTGHGEDGLWVAASVRRVAAELGVSKNAAHRALLVLREAGLILAAQHRGCCGRFDVGTYVLAISTDIVQSLPGSSVTHCSASAGESIAFPGGVPSRRANRPRQVEQLVLLPSV